MTYIPKGCDQQGRLEPGSYLRDPGASVTGTDRIEPDDWDAAGVAEEGKSGTKAIGMVITAVIVAAAAWVVFA